ncbi:MAG: exopolyphosphatase, partial [bacterium]
LRRGDHADPTSNEAAFAHLTIAVRDADRDKVGRKFSNAAIEMALASYPGFTGTGPPGDASQVGVFWPALVASEAVEHRVVIGDDTIDIAPVALPAAFTPASSPSITLPAPPSGATRDIPLGTICGARSGDKGGNANVGVWARTPEAYAWLAAFLTVARLRELISEARDLEVERHELPNLLALNFVVKGLLGDGVAASLRSDPQAKTLGEYLRAKVVAVPVALL